MKTDQAAVAAAGMILISATTFFVFWQLSWFSVTGIISLGFATVWIAFFGRVALSHKWYYVSTVCAYVSISVYVGLVAIYLVAIMFKVPVIMESVYKSMAALSITLVMGAFFLHGILGFGGQEPKSGTEPAAS